MKADVLVIVVSWNAMQWIDRCIGSVYSSSVRADVLVVDNGSTDGTREHIRGRFPEAMIIESAGNQGFGAANNIGFRYALDKGYRFVYLLNQDAWVGKHCLERLLDAARPEYAVLSPVQNAASGKYDRQFARKCGKYLKVLKNIVADETLVVEVPFVMAAHWLVSREALLRVGGFSPAFRQYGEDDNFIDRVHYHGLHCGVVPAADAVHDRARRKLAKGRRMEIKCVAAVVRLSDPSGCFFWRRILAPLELLGMSVKNFSSVPLHYIPVLNGRMAELKKLRRESMKKGAFLR